MSWWSSNENQVLNLLTPGFNVGSMLQTSQDKNDATSRMNEYLKKLMDLVPQYQSQSNQANKSINDLFSNTPKLDLSNNKSALTDIGKSTTTDVNKYLTKGDEYINSMLGESKKLANSDMPGVDIYKDQMGTSMASSLANLKNMGGASSSNVSSLLQGNQQNQLNLALEASKYKTNMQQNLAKSYGEATGMEQNQAGVRQNLGSFGANIEGQKSDLTSQEFKVNQLMPWQSKMQWEQTQSQAFDPLKYMTDIYGSQVGMARSDQQSAKLSQQQNTDTVNKTNTDIFAAIMAMI